MGNRTAKEIKKHQSLAEALRLLLAGDIINLSGKYSSMTVNISTSILRPILSQVAQNHEDEWRKLNKEIGQ